jgi:hypothetical protein
LKSGIDEPARHHGAERHHEDAYAAHQSALHSARFLGGWGSYFFGSSVGHFEFLARRVCRIQNQKQVLCQSEDLNFM